MATQPRTRRGTTGVLVGLVVVLSVISLGLAAYVIWTPELRGGSADPPGTSDAAANGTATDGTATEGTSTVLPSEASAEVDETGFSIALDGVVITGEPGVASIDSVVRARTAPVSLTGDFGDFTTPVGDGVDVTLDGGAQPLSPISITFSIPAELWPESGELMVLGESPEEGREAEFVETIVDEDELTVTGIATHLSWYTVATVDEDRLGEKLGHWFDVALDVRTDRPDCVDEPTRLSGSFVLAEPWPDMAWVCIEETDEDVTVRLQSNSGLVLAIAADSGGSIALPVTSSSEDIATTAVYMQWLRYADSAPDGILLPGGTTEITFPKPFDGAEISLSADPALSQISTLAWGTSMLMPTRVTSLIDWGDCVSDLVGSSFSGSADQASAVLGCVATATAEYGGELLGTVLEAPGKLTAQIEGAIGEVTGANYETFSVHLVSGLAVQEISSTSSWLYELPHTSGLTSGDSDIAVIEIDGNDVSFPLSTNQWVGCQGTTNSVTYTLDGEWTEVSFAFAVQSHAPAGTVVDWTLSVDGSLIHIGSTTRGDPLERLDFDVTGAQEIEVTAKTDGPCEVADKGYAALVQGYVDK
ncbi:hypothetical protein ACXET9_11020 [Brachybacterium sp. DNPG3]